MAEQDEIFVIELTGFDAYDAMREYASRTRQNELMGAIVGVEKISEKYNSNAIRKAENIISRKDIGSGKVKILDIGVKEYVRISNTVERIEHERMQKVNSKHIKYVLFHNGRAIDTADTLSDIKAKVFKVNDDSIDGAVIYRGGVVVGKVKCETKIYKNRPKNMFGVVERHGYVAFGVR